MLAHYYPEYAHKITAPVEPGVATGPLREFRAVDPLGGVIGFVGKEWQRKGLPLIADVVAELRRTRPNLELHVVGPAPEEVQHLFAGWLGGYRLLGWRSDNEYLRDFDVLLHPARAEPYGMVIAEAMAARVPVVVSDVCGAAASVGAESGAVLPLSSPVAAWAEAVEAQLRRADATPRFNRDWRAVAVEYETIYKSCLNGEMQ
jgi:UDP-glucose:(heptosyl)LPS alpha-1,3-glucosyltransferase